MRLPARATVTATLAAGLLAALPGCAEERRPDAPPPPQARSPVELCVDLVAYWVKEALKGSKWAGLDWEQKGLSNEQLTIHDEVLARARAEERARGGEAASAFVDKEIRRRCASANGATGSSADGKPPT